MLNDLFNSHNAFLCHYTVLHIKILTQHSVGLRRSLKKCRHLWISLFDRFTVFDTVSNNTAVFIKPDIPHITTVYL